MYLQYKKSMDIAKQRAYGASISKTAKAASLQYSDLHGVPAILVLCEKGVCAWLPRLAFGAMLCYIMDFCFLQTRAPLKSKVALLFCVVMIGTQLLAWQPGCSPGTCC